MTEEQLLVQAGRDRAAFEEFYRRTVARVVAFAARRCSRPEEVPDLVAAIWLEVIASAHRFDPRRGRAVPWVLGVAAHVTASVREEAARALGLRPAAARMRLARARRKLREALGDPSETSVALRRTEKVIP